MALRGCSPFFVRVGVSVFRANSTLEGGGAPPGRPIRKGRIVAIRSSDVAGLESVDLSVYHVHNLRTHEKARFCVDLLSGQGVSAYRVGSQVAWDKWQGRTKLIAVQSCINQALAFSSV